MPISFGSAGGSSGVAPLLIEPMRAASARGKAAVNGPSFAWMEPTRAASAGGSAGAAVIAGAGGPGSDGAGAAGGAGAAAGSAAGAGSGAGLASWVTGSPSDPEHEEQQAARGGQEQQLGPDRP
jgi:hypothetical protein